MMKKILLFILIFVMSISIGFSSDIYEDKLLKSMNNYTDTIPIFIKLNSNYNGDLEDIINISYEYDLVEFISANISISDLENLSEIEGIESVQYDEIITSHNRVSSVQTGVSIGRSMYSLTGKDITVAVLDSGISNHIDLENVIGRVDFTASGIGDYTGHGTHVAGIIAGTNPLFSGVAPGASLVDVKVLDNNGSGRVSDMIRGIEYSVNQDVDIISMSIGAESPCSVFNPGAMAVSQAIREGKVVVISAGNMGPDEKTLTDPGCAQNAITVGAVNKDDEIADFSSRGPNARGFPKPDIVAPGVGIISTNIDSGYVRSSGTSMAAPHVSGIIALLLEANPDLTPQEVKLILTNTAKDLEEDLNSQGAGRVQFLPAIYEALIESDEDITIHEMSINQINNFLVEQGYLVIAYKKTQPDTYKIFLQDGNSYQIIEIDSTGNIYSQKSLNVFTFIINSFKNFLTFGKYL